MKRFALLLVVLFVLASSVSVQAELQAPVVDNKFGFKVQVPGRWQAQPLPPPTDYDAMGLDSDLMKLFDGDTEFETILIYKANLDEWSGDFATFRLFRCNGKDLDAVTKIAREYADGKSKGNTVKCEDFRPKCPKTKMKKLTYSYKWRDGTSQNEYVFVAFNANGGFMMFYSYPAGQKQLTTQVEDSAKTFAWVEKKEVKKKPGHDLPAGWNVHETENYIIQYNATDVEKVKLFGKRVEKLHSYHAKFLPKKADVEKYRPQSIRSKLTVKYFKDQNGFDNYAGDQLIFGAAAYYSPGQNEIAFYLTGWTKETMCILYHEATHQYLQEFLGGPAVDFHTWINEGTSEYFFGAGSDDPDKVQLGTEMRDGIQEVKSDIKKGETLDLEKLTMMSQSQVYAMGRRGYNYSWSLVYFLVHSPNKAYNQVVPKYFYKLQSTVFPLLTELEKVGDITEKITVTEGEGEEGEEGDEGEEGKPDERTKYDVRKDLRKAQETAREYAFDGIDFAKLKADWEAFYSSK